jgi:hypothetical protein
MLAEVMEKDVVILEGHWADVLGLLKRRVRGSFIDDVKILLILEYFDHFREHFTTLAKLHIFVLQNLVPGEFVLESF